MKFTLHRNHVLSSTLGHSVEFKKGQPTYVPPSLHREAISIGAIPESELPDPDENKPTDPVEPDNPQDREAAIFAAFETIVLRNKREDFTAGGAPHGKALKVELGWEVPGKERDQAWANYQAAQAKADSEVK